MQKWKLNQDEVLKARSLKEPRLETDSTISNPEVLKYLVENIQR